MIDKISLILTYFIIYSFLGWILESIYKSIIQRKIINSGFLNGPFCPIYGFGAIILYFCLDGVKNNFVIAFLIGVIVFSIWEYLVGVILEKIFKTKYWDYSNERFNYKGRICLNMSLSWGLLGIFFIYILHPFVSEVVFKIPVNVITPICAFLFLYLIIDCVISSIKIKNLDIRLSKLTQIQESISVKLGEVKKLQLQDLKVLANKNIQLDLLRKSIEELKQTEYNLRNKLNKRIARLKKAFPTMKSQKITEFLNQKFENIKKEKKER